MQNEIHFAIAPVFVSRKPDSSFKKYVFFRDFLGVYCSLSFCGVPFSSVILRSANDEESLCRGYTNLTLRFLSAMPFGMTAGGCFCIV